MVRETLADYFDFEEHNTDLRTEIIAGITTFLTMSYIVVVNPDILAIAITDIPGRTGAEIEQMLAVVTIISAAIATLIMALYANRPFAQAPGLGLNAFFAFTVVLGLGVPWQTALAAVVVEGVLFILLTVAGAREYVIKLFPEPVKFAVGAGIGLFLAIIGLQAMHVIASDTATFIQFNPVFAEDPIAIISVVGLFITFGLYAARIPGSIILGIIITTVISYGASILDVSPHPTQFEHFGAPVSLYEPASMVGETSVTYSMAGYDITPLIGAFIEGFGNVDALGFSLIVFTFFFVDFFDTAGTLTGVAQTAGFLDKEGNLPNIDRPLLGDAIGTTIGGMIGTSTVTTYIESSAGVEEGGRTGMTALVVALLFIGSLVLVPLAAVIPLHASHIALVVVAVLMLQNITAIEWDNIAHAVPAGLTVFVMPFTFSIAYGIAAGIISYPLVKAAQGEWRDVHVGQWVMAAAFVLYFFVRTSGILEGAL